MGVGVVPKPDGVNPRRQQPEPWGSSPRVAGFARAVRSSVLRTAMTGRSPPLRVLECLGIGALLLWLEKRKRYDGQVLLVYLLLHGSTRVGLDFLRHEELPHLQWTSLALVVIAAAGLLLRAAVGSPSRLAAVGGEGA